MCKRILLVAATLVVASAVSGCVALGIGAAAGAGGVMYAKGRVTDTLSAPIERVYNASLATLESQNLPIKNKHIDPANADINSEYLNGDEIRIDIESQSSDVSTIHIRVGLTGNKDQSIDLLEKIKARV